MLVVVAVSLAGVVPQIQILHAGSAKSRLVKAFLAGRSTLRAHCVGIEGEVVSWGAAGILRLAVHAVRATGEASSF